MSRSQSLTRRRTRHQAPFRGEVSLHFRLAWLSRSSGAIGEISTDAVAYRVPAVCTNYIDNPRARGRCLYSPKVVVSGTSEGSQRGKMTHTRNSLNRGRIDPQHARACVNVELHQGRITGFRRSEGVGADFSGARDSACNPPNFLLRFLIIPVRRRKSSACRIAHMHTYRVCMRARGGYDSVTRDPVNGTRYPPR